MKLCLLQLSSTEKSDEISYIIASKIDQFPDRSGYECAKDQLIHKIKTISEKVVSLPPDEYAQLTKLKPDSRTNELSENLMKVMRDAVIALRKRRGPDQKGCRLRQSQGKVLQGLLNLSSQT